MQPFDPMLVSCFIASALAALEEGEPADARAIADRTEYVYGLTCPSDRLDELVRAAIADDDRLEGYFEAPLMLDSTPDETPEPPVVATLPLFLTPPPPPPEGNPVSPEESIRMANELLGLPRSAVEAPPMMDVVLPPPPDGAESVRLYVGGTLAAELKVNENGDGYTQDPNVGDAKLAALIPNTTAAIASSKPVCFNCGDPVHAQKRCTKCYSYFKRRGAERPIDKAPQKAPRSSGKNKK